MKKRVDTIVLGIAVGIGMFGCNPESPSIGLPPPAPSFAYDTTNPNRIVFTVTEAQGFMINWDFGIGDFSADYLLFPGQDSTFSQKNKDTVFYPFPDTYTITLTTSDKGGATSYSREVVVNTFDSSVIHNNLWNLLTGGPDSIHGKTWVWAKDDSAYMWGTTKAPNSTYKDPIKYNGKIPPYPKPEGALNDEYVFNLAHFRYENNCKGDFLYNWMWAKNLLGMNCAKDSVFEYTPGESSWELTKQSDSTVILTLTYDGYLGICAGTSTYQVLKLTEDTLNVRFEMVDPDDPYIGTSRTQWNYLRLLAKK